MGRVRLWIAGLLGILFLVVVFQNLDRTSLTVLFWSWELPLLVVMVAFTALGALLGVLVALTLLARAKTRPPV